jgi:hypothetical protein
VRIQRCSGGSNEARKAGTKKKTVEEKTFNHSPPIAGTALRRQSLAIRSASNAYGGDESDNDISIEDEGKQLRSPNASISDTNDHLPSHGRGFDDDLRPTAPAGNGNSAYDSAANGSSSSNNAVAETLAAVVAPVVPVAPAVAVGETTPTAAIIEDLRAQLRVAEARAVCATHE